MNLADFKRSWMAKHNSPAIFISATEKENIDEFRDAIYERVKAVNQKIYPFNNFLY
jgi:GTP-binding protein HflX